MAIESKKSDHTDTTIHLPREVIQLHHIAGWKDPYRHKLHYVKLEFDSKCVVAVATNGQILVVLEWPVSSSMVRGYDEHFAGKTFYIHASSLKVVSYMQRQLKSSFGTKDVCLNGAGKLVSCGHIVETPPFSEKEWLDWRQAIGTALAGSEHMEVIDPSVHGSLSEVTLDLKLLEKIRKYVASCGKSTAFHFKFTSDIDVVQGRLTSNKAKSFSSRKYMHMDFFVMPMKQEAGKWEVHHYLRKQPV